MSGKNTDISVGNSFTVAAAENVGLFAQHADMKLYAGKGNVDIQAQAGALNTQANQDITIASAEGRVEICAASELVLKNAEGSFIQISSKNIVLGCAGNILLKAANVDQTGPETLNIPPISLTKGYSEEFTTTSLQTGEVKPFTHYRMTTGEGEVYEGISDAEGKTIALYTSNTSNTSKPSEIKIDHPRGVSQNQEGE